MRPGIAERRLVKWTDEFPNLGELEQVGARGDQKADCELDRRHIFDKVERRNSLEQVLVTGECDPGIECNECGHQDEVSFASCGEYSNEVVPSVAFGEDGEHAVIERLERGWDASDSLVCVGLDPEIERFPAQFAEQPSPIFQFNKAIIDATADLVCAYKPQFAHYAAYEAEDQLERTIDYIHRSYPGIPVILDSKRGDVGNTAERYAIEAFERYHADAVTVSPYLGGDSMEPFLKYEEKGVIILCRTSNPGAGDLQDLEISGRRLFHIVADLAARRWNTRGNCLLVVGATYPRELAEVREIVGNMPFLVPGVGAQGGDVAQAVQNGQTAAGAGLVMSSSRGILYASSGENFASAAREVTMKLRDQINASRVRRAR